MRVLALAAALITFGLAGAQTAKREVAVAAAANLSTVFQTLGPQFESETGIHPVFSFASTAQLAAQIENGAPFDVFTAADTEHVDALEKKSLLVPGSRAVYAIGVLALWIPPGSHASVAKLSDLTQPAVKVIALAKPELAPYGLAARETLQKLGIWNQVQSRIVYADNINMAKQYGTSGNADAVFTAYSLVLKEAGKVIPVDESLHSPINQALGIVAASKNQDAAKAFTAWLLTGHGRDGLRAFGYRVGR
ncbi:MAG TPA: molybdate ABC transporter substrate-binding protein [Bryobacteraceae bacterium]|nr:molybdate ABC transporter substrate-binding protein [Bryobacteraceae bacterium]